MGIIKRQAIKNNLIAFVGVGIGLVSRFIIYPQDKALGGYSDAIIGAALLLVPFIRFGSTIVMVRFLPYLETGDKKTGANQLLARGLAVMTTGLITVALANWLGEDWLNRMFPRGVLHDSRWVILGVTAALVYAEALTSHLVNFNRIAVPVIFNNILIKVGVPVIFLLVISGIFNVGNYGLLLIGVYALAVVGLLVYAYGLGVLKGIWGKLALSEKQKRQMYIVTLFSVFGEIGARLSVYIDTLSINTYLGNVDTNVYTLAKFVVGVIVIPSAAITAITAPIVTKAWREKDMDHLRFLYRESSMVLYVIGATILTGAVVCLPVLYDLIPKFDAYRAGYLCVLLLGCGQLLDLMTSINGSLIGMTDYFRWNIVFVLSLGVLNGILNYVFIEILGYGITGAAVATALSLALYNGAKVGLVYWKMRMHPFSMSLLYSTLVMLLAGGAAFSLPDFSSDYVNLFLRGSVVVVIFILYLRFTSAVPAARRLLTQGVAAAFRQ